MRVDDSRGGRGGARAAPSGAAALSGHRRDRLDGQDDDEGLPSQRPRHIDASCCDRGEPEQRARRPAHRHGRWCGNRGARRGDGDAGAGTDRSPVLDRTPTAGLVTNVGVSHVEILGTEEAIASAKGELVRAIPPAGRVFLNGDDGWTITLETSRGGSDHALRPGGTLPTSGPTTWRSPRTAGRRSRSLPGRRAPRSTLPVPGRHNVYNALAAAAVGLYLGLALGRCGARSRGRDVLEVADGDVPERTGVTVINDAYNANPTSMRAALSALGDVPSAWAPDRGTRRHGRTRVACGTRALPARGGGVGIGNRRARHRRGARSADRRGCARGGHGSRCGAAVRHGRRGLRGARRPRGGPATPCS